MTAPQSGASALPAFQSSASQGALWRAVLADPQLQNLPFKIETNQRGQLILSPHKRIHSLRQTQITDLLARAVDRKGVRSVELAIATSKGVKVVDAAWMSAERLAAIPDDVEPTPVAPELCVEVLSSPNTEDEMAEKRTLYMEAGADEVWIVHEDGTVRFYDREGPRETSQIAPDFPAVLPPVADPAR